MIIINPTKRCRLQQQQGGREREVSDPGQAPPAPAGWLAKTPRMSEWLLLPDLTYWVHVSVGGST